MSATSAPCSSRSNPERRRLNDAIDAASAAARKSPCAKDQRGAAVWHPDGSLVIADQWRGQAMAFELYAQKRRVAATVVVFTPPGIHANDFAVADKMERVVERIAYLMISAAQSLHEIQSIDRYSDHDDRDQPRPLPPTSGVP